ncbi:SUMF1/EgtB/PvdO family nonheme iron enzyme [Bacteroidota bacterium]
MSKILRVIFIVFLILLNKCVEEPPISITEFAAIGGTVKDSQEDPLERVKVSADNKETYTDSSGYFVLNNLKNGELRIFLYKEGYQGDSSTYVEVNKKEMITQNFTLIKLGGIYGTVKNSNGEAIVGAEISTNPESIITYTDENGYYEITSLQEGEYSVYTMKQGYIKDSLEVEVNNEQQSKVDFILLTRGGINGTVTNSSEEPLEGVEITTEPQTSEVYTNASGYYEITDIDAGTYTIYASKDGYIQSSTQTNVVNDILTQVDIVLLTRGGINGTVTNSSEEPLEGVEITTEPQTSEVYTNASGYYEITDIDAGTYTVYASKEGYIQSSEQTEVVNEEITNVDFVLIKWMIYVQGGTFEMGDTFGDGESDEKPPHNITLDDFYISKYEVTNSQYAEFLNSEGNQREGGVTWLDINDSDCRIEYTGGEYKPESGYEDHPVVEVSWYGARAYCGWFGGRLPTEAEWEYAARGGIESNGYKYSGSDNIEDVAWYSGNSGGTAHAVGTKNPNELGIYDMSGNVWEWCNDWYDADYYDISPDNNPQGPVSGTYKVLRGGSWNNLSRNCRVSYRFRGSPVFTYAFYGFRVALDL